MKVPAWLISGILLTQLLPAVAQTSRGDLNSDGQVDAADAQLLDQYLKGSTLFSEEQTQQADINGDGTVNSQDRTALARQLNPDAVTADSPTNGVRNFNLGVAKVVPEWVRGGWDFNSQIIEGHGGFASDGYQRGEFISLPGDLSGQYIVVTNNGERLRRLCWQVDSYDDEHFQFTERLRDSRGGIYQMTNTINNQSTGQAKITIKVQILVAPTGRTLSLGGGGDFLNNLLGSIFGSGGGQQSSFQKGAYYIRTGTMYRRPDTENTRLPNVDLDQLRCRNYY